MNNILASASRTITRVTLKALKTIYIYIFSSTFTFIRFDPSVPLELYYDSAIYIIAGLTTALYTYLALLSIAPYIEPATTNSPSI